MLFRSLGREKMATINSIPKNMANKNTMEEYRNFLKEGGNIIKTRDDRDLIWIASNGVIQNQEDCDWGIEETDVIDNLNIYPCYAGREYPMQ